jgi:hypothetical protein
MIKVGTNQDLYNTHVEVVLYTWQHQEELFFVISTLEN